MLYAHFRSHLNRYVNITSTLKNCLNVQLRSKHQQVKHNLTMNEAYLRYENGNESFNFSFRYVNKELNVDRQFNFTRKSSEVVSNFLKRIDNNLEKSLIRKKRKKQQDDTVVNIESHAKLLLNGSTVDGEKTCGTIFQENADVSVVIFDTVYSIKHNAPWITSMTLPTCILAGFPVYPTKFESVYTKKSDSVFTWYKSCSASVPNSAHKNTDEWMEVGQGYLYISPIADIGCKLKLTCLPCCDGLVGPIIEVESSCTVEAGPGTCPFETRHLFTPSHLYGKSFRMVSYNILADFYADTDFARDVLFPYCPPYALAVDYRKHLVLKELIGFKSDIICLQEVDNKIFDMDLLPTLSMLKYDGVFNRKGGDVMEGISTFFNTDRFKKLNFESVVMAEHTELEEFKDVWDKVQKENTRKRFLERHTAVQVTTLQGVDNPSEILVIGNTHLYYHPDASHVRLLQGYYALVYVSKAARTVKDQNPTKNVSIILAGDFNSVPGCGIYQLMTKKYVPEDYKDWSSNAEEAVENISLAHDLSFASACGTPQYTNYTSGFADCLDYIYYQTDSLKVTQVVPMPSNEELEMHTALPSVVFPSDHVSLCADFEWVT